jgi:hypothetical protein
MLHVIDLADFGRLTLVAQQPARFNQMMMNRFFLMMSQKTAFIRGKLSPYE